MKVMKKVLSVSGLALLLSASPFSSAQDEAYYADGIDGVSAQPVQGNSGSRLVRRVGITKSGVVRLRANTAWNNPDGCSSSQEIVVADRANAVDNPYYSEHYALVIASYLQGKNVSATLNGCKPLAPGGSDTRPYAQSVFSYE